MGAVRKTEPVITLSTWAQGKGLVMPKIVGSKKRPRAKKHVEGVAVTLPEKMTLREIREDVAKMTIVEFAEHLGTTRSTYWFWEQGKRPMPEKYRHRVEALIAQHAQGQAKEADNGHGEEERPAE